MKVQKQVIKDSKAMDVPEGAYGAYAYAPGVGLSRASDYYCYGKKEKVSHKFSEMERFLL